MLVNKEYKAIMIMETPSPKHWTLVKNELVKEGIIVKKPLGQVGFIVKDLNTNFTIKWIESDGERPRYFAFLNELIRICNLYTYQTVDGKQILLYPPPEGVICIQNLSDEEMVFVYDKEDNSFQTAKPAREYKDAMNTADYNFFYLQPL